MRSYWVPFDGWSTAPGWCSDRLGEGAAALPLIPRWDGGLSVYSSFGGVIARGLPISAHDCSAAVRQIADLKVCTT